MSNLSFSKPFIFRFKPCEGCGRSHQEIAETKKMIKELVSYAQKMEYENVEDYANFIGTSVLNKLQNPS